MALELATRLILRSAEDGSPLAPERLRQLCALWAENADCGDRDVTDAPGRNRGRVTARAMPLGSARSRWDLALSVSDSEDETVEWRTEITSIFDPDRTTLAVRLRRESADHRLRPLTGSPLPPRVIRDVLRTRDLDCFDGPLRVEPRYRELTQSGVDGFIETNLLAEDRRLPVIAIAKQSSPSGRLDVGELTRVLAGFAHVVLVDRAALPRLAHQLGNLSLGRPRHGCGGRACNSTMTRAFIRTGTAGSTRPSMPSRRSASLYWPPHVTVGANRHEWSSSDATYVASKRRAAVQRQLALSKSCSAYARARPLNEHSP